MTAAPQSCQPNIWHAPTPWTCMRTVLRALLWSVLWIPTGWLLGNIIIGYMSEHHLFPCWGCGI